MDPLWSAISFACLGGGPVVCFHGFRALHVKRLIENTPTARIRSLAMGMVELNGRVEPRSRVVAPFSGHECVYWEIEIQTLANSKNGSKAWNTVHRNRSGHPFYLRDETGLAMVMPMGAQCRTSFGVSEETMGLGVPEPYASYMAERGLALRHLWAVGRMRFQERQLEAGQGVYVLGRAMPPPRSVVISMDDEALEATGTDAIGARHVRTNDADLKAVICKGERSGVFLISDRSEKTMTFEYGLKAFAGTVGGLLLTVFGLWGVMALMKSGQFLYSR